MTYFIKELEEMSREKLFKCNTDQFTLVIDMSGAKLKDLQNKNTQSILQALVELFSKYYPCIIHKIFVMNAPMFFDDIWESFSELVDHDSSDRSNFIISNKNSHADLTATVDSDKLPAVYGGSTKFDLKKGLFNEVGPWSIDTELIWIDEEEQKDEDDMDDMDDQDEGIEDDIKTAIQGIPTFLGTGGVKKQQTKVDENTGGEVNFNLEALGELINQTPNATPMNTQADEE